MNKGQVGNYSISVGWFHAPHTLWGAGEGSLWTHSGRLPDLNSLQPDLGLALQGVKWREAQGE